MKIRNSIAGFIAFSCILVLIFDSKTASAACTEGVTLCVQTVIPSLFPFMVMSAWLNGMLSSAKIGVLRHFGNVFGLARGQEFILIPAFLGGYPVGAQIIGQSWREKRIGQADAERILQFCNNAGPAFLFGMVSKSFADGRIAWKLWLIQILSAMAVSWLFPSKSRQSPDMQIKGSSLTKSMETAIGAMARICGWIILFRMVSVFLDRWFLWYFPNWLRVFVIGSLELTNGCCQLATIRNEFVRFLIASVLLNMGGLCIVMQTASVIWDLSLKKYILGKSIQSVAAFLLACCAYHHFLRTVPVLLGWRILFLVRNQKKSRFPQSVSV